MRRGNSCLLSRVEQALEEVLEERGVNISRRFLGCLPFLALLEIRRFQEIQAKSIFPL